MQTEKVMHEEYEGLEGALREKEVLKRIYKDIERQPHGGKGMKLLRYAMEHYFDLGNDGEPIFHKFDDLLRVLSIKFPALAPIYEHRRSMALKMCKEPELADMLHSMWLEVVLDDQLRFYPMGGLGFERIKDARKLQRNIDEWDFSTIYNGWIPSCIVEPNMEAKAKGFSVRKLQRLLHHAEREKHKKWLKELEEEREQERIEKFLGGPEDEPPKPERPGEVVIGIQAGRGRETHGPAHELSETQLYLRQRDKDKGEAITTKEAEFRRKMKEDFDALEGKGKKARERAKDKAREGLGEGHAEQEEEARLAHLDPFVGLTKHDEFES